MMSLHSKRIYALMMREINIMGPYNIDKVCGRAGINPYLITEKDLPYLTNALSEIIMAHKGKERAKKFVQEMEKLYDIDTTVRGEKDPKKRITYLFDIADVRRLMGDFESAKQHYHQILKLAKENDLDPVEARVNRKLGTLHFALYETEIAREYLQAAYNLASDTDDRDQLARAELALGTLLWRIGNFDEALERINSALDLAKERNDERLTSQITVRLASILSDSGKQDEALKMWEEAIRVLEKINDYINLSRAMNNMGVLLKWRDQYDESIALYRKSYDAADAVNFQRGKGYALANMAECLIKVNKLKEAKAKMAEAKEIFLNMKDVFMMTGMEFLEALLLKAEGNPGAAEEKMEGCIRELREYQSPTDLAWAIYELGLVKKELGKPGWKEALDEACEIYKDLGNETLREKVASLKDA